MSTPTARRRLLGLALREYRQKVGCDMAVAAHVLDCDVSKISRIETGQRPVRAKELKELLAAYGVREEQQDMLLSLSGSKRGAPPAWWQGYTDILPSAYLEYLAAEDNASRILSYSPSFIPELLQSQDYAVAVANAGQQARSGIDEQFAQAIRARQAAVLESGQTNLSVVLGEAALRQQVGYAQLMGEQLERIIDLARDTSWINVQVLPFAVGSRSIINCGSLSILRFPALPTLGLAYLDGPNGGICLEQPQDVGAYAQAFQQAQAAALNPAASLELIKRLAKK